MSVRTACPLCNAWNYAEKEDLTDRVACSRCGESFAATRWEPATDADEAAAMAQPAAAPKPMIWRMLPPFVALCCMLVAAWLTFRPEPTQPPPPPRAAAVQPAAALAGLRHLPDGVGIVFAIQPAAMLEMTGTQPRELLDLTGDPGGLFAALDRAGVKPGDIEQIVGGISLARDRLVPGLTIYLRLRSEPRDPDAFLTALRAVRRQTKAKVIYTTSISGMLLKPLGGGAYLLGLGEDDLSIETPRPNLDHLADDIRQSLSERLSPAAFAWVIAGSRDWSTASPILQLPGGEELAARLAQGRSAAAGFSCEPSTTLKLTLSLRDAAAAEAVAGWLKERLPPKAVVEIVGSELQATSDANFETVGRLIREARQALLSR